MPETVLSLDTLQAELARHQRAMAQFQASLIFLDLDGYVTGWSPAAEQIFGYSADEAVGRHILFLYADESADDAFLFNRFLDDDRQVTVKYSRSNGEDFWARMLLMVERDEQGHPQGLMLFILDVNAITAQEERERLHARMLELSRDAVILLDTELRLISANPAYHKLLATDMGEDLVGRKPAFIDFEGMEASFWQAFHSELRQDDGWQGDLQALRGGQPFPFWINLSAVRDDVGALLGYFCILSDLSKHETHTDIGHGLMHFDNLTRLPNRAMFITLVDRALKQYKRKRIYGALLYVTVNGLDLFDEKFGYLMTDQLLIEAAKRLRTQLRDADILGRLDGHTFIICLFDVAIREQAALVASRLSEAFGLAFTLQGSSAELSVNIGISAYPEDGETTLQLVRNASIANTRAAQDNEAWLFYTDQMQQRAEERFRLDAMIRQGIENQEFCLYYQPKVDARTGRLVSAEALIRLLPAGGKLVPPGVFMPYADQTRHIHAIGEFVIQSACRQLRTWQDAGLPLVRVSVNVSANQIRTGFCDVLMGHLARHEVPTEFLEVELTESAIMSNEAIGLRFLEKLRSEGIAVSMDDFGTGYSNIAMLRRLPFSTLKIDRSFVINLTEQEEDRVIFKAIMSMSEALGFETIAEGVETAEQADYLSAHGCHIHQGYLYAKPMPPEEFAEWLARLKP